MVFCAQRVLEKYIFFNFSFWLVLLVVGVTFDLFFDSELRVCAVVGIRDMAVVLVVGLYARQDENTQRLFLMYTQYNIMFLCQIWDVTRQCHPTRTN